MKKPNLINEQQRNVVLDCLKGIAIIAVALYHFSVKINLGGVTLEDGILPYGYLGVDIFYVISGYFFLKSLYKAFEGKTFNYFGFIIHKLNRLWPLILIVSGFALLMGFFLMLPDDYENLAESVVASSFFANNILACITTKNYWDVVNQYKPLMHLWYIGVLMQAYVILPILYVIFVKICENERKGFLIGTLALTVGSLALFMVPCFSNAWKFYYLPFRIFEITIGGFILFRKHKPDKNYKLPQIIVAFVLLLTMLFTRNVFLSKDIMLLTVVLTTMFIIASTEKTSLKNSNIIVKFLFITGKASYSIYIWHQCIIAFLFYSFFYKKDFMSFPVFLIISLLFSLLSYIFIEIPLGKVAYNSKLEKSITVCCIFSAVLLCVFSLYVYLHAGVVRDVPELNISKQNIHQNMHAEYCDRPYKWDKDFSNDKRLHILVLGNSFGRDWANILYEYDFEKRLDISYIYYTEKNLLNKLNRIDSADLVFYAKGPGYKAVPSLVISKVPVTKLFIVGNKNFGESNGIVYARRGTNSYYEQTVLLPNELINENNEEKNKWKNHYIDMLAPVITDNGSARVFTEDKKFISQDCRHLTQAGTRYYSKVLNIKDLLNVNH